jgi:hypothetical protein
MCVHGVRGMQACLPHGHWPLEANTRCPSCAIVRSVFVDPTLTSLCTLQTWFLCRSSWYAFGPSVSQPLMEQVGLPCADLCVLCCAVLCANGVADLCVLCCAVLCVNGVADLSFFANSATYCTKLSQRSGCA